MKFIIASRRIIFGLAFGMFFMNSNLYAANITSTQFTIFGVLEAKTCAFNESELTVDLPEVDTQILNHSNAIQGETKFTMSLICSGGVTSVNIIPYGTSVDAGDSTLFLNSNSAKNVGLRLLDKDRNILKPNGQTKITIDYNESGGKYTFSAGYAATGSGRVSGGLFQSLVYFNIDYN